MNTCDIKRQIGRLLDQMTVGDRARVLAFCRFIQECRSGKRQSRLLGHSERYKSRSELQNKTR